MRGSPVNTPPPTPWARIPPRRPRRWIHIPRPGRPPFPPHVGCCGPVNRSEPLGEGLPPLRSTASGASRTPCRTSRSLVASQPSSLPISSATSRPATPRGGYGARPHVDDTGGSTLARDETHRALEGLGAAVDRELAKWGLTDAERDVLLVAWRRRADLPGGPSLPPALFRTVVGGVERDEGDRVRPLRPHVAKDAPDRSSLGEPALEGRERGVRWPWRED